MKKQVWNGVIALLVIAFAFVPLGCQPVTEETPEATSSKTATPAVSPPASVEKTAESPSSVDFTLTNAASAYPTGTTWKVYDAATGGTNLTGTVDATFTAPTLTLTSMATPPDITAQHYWVTATESFLIPWR